MTNYYTYIYLDTRKPGEFVFSEFTFDFEPIYVGKGKNKRINIHLTDNSNINILLKRKIKKIIKETGKPPLILKVKDNLSEEESFKLEKLLIKLIGRIDLNIGTLCNMTDGGEGLINCSEYTKDKLRKPFTQERRMNVSKSKKGKKVSKEIRELLLKYSKVSIVYLDSNLNKLKCFSSIKEACLELNLTNASIHRYCNYYFNMRNGNTFRYNFDINGQNIYIKNIDNDKSKKILQDSRTIR